ncbi:MAG: Formyl transferase protein [uncultured bacterium]|nr:MAG: Formyl transferase protein [uncultured bacterium]
MQTKKVAKIHIAGPDKCGIIATITNFLFKNQCNIEDIDQRIHDDFLIMNMVIDYSDLKIPLATLTQTLKLEAQKVGCQSQLKVENQNQLKNLVILVTKESHCLETLLNDLKDKKLKGKLAAIIGNYEDLKPLAIKHKIPFHLVPSVNRKKHEQEILKLLDSYETDLVVLARYMQILSPDFVFRYEGRIINIHPSLLPAFPGPRSYHQAFNKGVEIAGVTSHFVTTDLDEGPIITQEYYRVEKGKDTPESMVKKGRLLEAKALSRAVKLFLSDRLVLRRGKVLDKKFVEKLSIAETEETSL